MDWWSIENDLVEQSLEELNDSVNVFTNSSLTSNTKFVHYQVQGGGHQWFNYNYGFHASEELLSFFMQYSMTDFENDDTPSIEGRWIIPVVESDPGNTMCNSMLQKSKESKIIPFYSLIQLQLGNLLQYL